MYVEPEDTITLPPVTYNPPVNAPNTLLCNPFNGEIDAVAEPDVILSNLKSFNAFTGILNNPPPSPK